MAAGGKTSTRQAAGGRSLRTVSTQGPWGTTAMYAVRGGSAKGVGGFGRVEGIGRGMGDGEGGGRAAPGGGGSGAGESHMRQWWSGATNSGPVRWPHRRIWTFATFEGIKKQQTSKQAAPFAEVGGVVGPGVEGGKGGNVGGVSKPLVNDAGIKNHRPARGEGTLMRRRCHCQLTATNHPCSKQDPRQKASFCYLFKIGPVKLIGLLPLTNPNVT